MGSRGSRWIVGAVGGYQGRLVGSRVTWWVAWSLGG